VASRLTQNKVCIYNHLHNIHENIFKAEKQSESFVFPDGEKYSEYSFIVCVNECSVVGECISRGGVIERSGQGTHWFNSGLVYTGHWERDRMEGHGETTVL